MIRLSQRRAGLSRRHLLMLAAAGPLSGCGLWSEPPPVVVGAGQSLIDVHCHLFNASDLPAEKFLRYVFLDLYRPAGPSRLLDVQDADVVDALLDLFLAIAGANRAPTAAEEIAVLSGQAPPNPAAADGDAADRVSIQKLDAYMNRSAMAGGASVTRGQAILRGAIARAAALPQAAARPSVGPAVSPAPSLAERSYFSLTDVGQYLRWFTLFTLYRYALTDRLAKLHADDGFTAKLLCPAMIDYSEWLEEDTVSPLKDQVEVMSLVSRRPTGPATHGYVAFDPLRQAYFERGLVADNPLGIVQDAIANQGFLGVKLYPPMGFRASNNLPSPDAYPAAIVKRYGASPGPALDQALAKLYDWCAKNGAPILAHAQDSNGDGPSYADRADPTFWGPVFHNWPKLRVCLAHFGGFTAQAGDGSPKSSPPLPETWEWAFGKLLNNSDAPIYRDISYLSQVWSDTPDQRSARAAAFNQYIAAFDKDCDHLMFGTDWVMLGSETNVNNYTGDVVKFLKQDCGMADARVQKILYDNALRFAGLRQGEAAFERLRGFYSANNLDLTRLPRAP